MSLRLSPCILLFHSVLLFAGAATLLTGSAAKVGEKVVTVRDVSYFAALHRLKEKKWSDPFASLPLEELKRYTKRVMLEEMCIAEIKSLDFLGPKKAEAAELVALQKAKGRAAWGEFLKFYGHTEEQAVELLVRSLTVDKFLEQKMETLTPLISEEEITQYLSQTGAKSSGSGENETVRQSVARLLRQEKMQKGLENWLSALQEKYLAVSLLP